MANTITEQTPFTMKPVSRAVLAACGTSVAMTAAPPAMAQEVAALEEIVVTARKRSESLQDVPISVMAFGAEQISKQGIKSLEDYARLIPSLTYSSWLPGSSIVVFRGVTVTADAFSGNSSAATYYNEMPISSQGLNVEVAMVDMARIEAVSGPQPTTYGASAQSGVLKFVTAQPDLESFSGFVDVTGAYMEEGNPSYDFQAMANIPMLDNSMALRVVGFTNKVGGYVDNIAGSTADTHDWTPAFETAAGQTAYPGGFDAPSNIAHVTKTNHAVARENVGDLETDGLRLTLAWELGENWLVTGMYNYQSSHADGIGSWEPQHGDLNQIRFNDETRDDDWYITTLVFEGDLGFADFTAATGYMDREFVYDLDSSTYLHQFQGVGGVYYNSFDIAYFPVGYYGYAYSLTVLYPAYNGSITGWLPNGVNYSGYPTYLITELSDVTSRMWNRGDTQRLTQELRLQSKDNDSRFQWMLGGFYEKIEDSYVFRGILDNFGQSLTGQIQENTIGMTIRSPGQSWYGKGDTIEEQWAVFGEIGFDLTDNLNLTVGARYFESETDDTNQTLNTDGTTTQNCLEDDFGACITDPAAVTPDNRLGTFGANNVGKDDGVLPLVKLTWNITDDVLTYATMAEGFRTGGTNILRSVSTAPDVYEEDVVTNQELGLKMTLLDGRLTWNMAIYQMTWEDMQLVAADPTISFGWGQVTVNAGEAEIEGLETNFAWAATDRLTFDGSLSLHSSEVTVGATIGDDVVIAEGEKLPLAPEVKFSLGAELGFMAGDWDGFARIDYSYVDEQTNSTQGSQLLTSSTLLRGTTTTMPDYSIANLIVGFSKDDWNINIALNNIADERAITYVPTRWTDGRLYSARPRELTFNFRKSF
jgi:outer membrane receptor protein involved in Fe transport